MSDIDTLSSSQPPSAASSRSEFAYRTHLVIYNFLRLVPSSLDQSPTEEVVETVAVESPVHFAPLASDNPVGSGRQEEDERGGGDARGSENAQNDGARGQVDRQGMFDELKTRVAERNQRKEADARESNQRAVQIRRMLREFMEKVNERDGRVNSDGDRAGSLPPAVTIIKKNNAKKFLVEPASPTPAVEQPIIAVSVPTTMPLGDGQMSDSPFGNPLCSSTPSSTPQSVVPPLHSEVDGAKVDRMSSSGSESNSAYIDIDMVDDVDSLVNAGIVPSVSKLLKDEISLCWQILERSQSSKFNSTDITFVFTLEVSYNSFEWWD